MAQNKPEIIDYFDAHQLAGSDPYDPDKDIGSIDGELLKKLVTSDLAKSLENSLKDQKKWKHDRKEQK